MTTFEKLEAAVRDKSGNFYTDADRRMFIVLCEEIDRLQKQINDMPRRSGVVQVDEFD